MTEGNRVGVTRFATPSDMEIVITRVVEAPIEQVFDAWTKPEEVAQWWDPTGTPLTSCEIDLRPGGSFTFVNAGHGAPFAGTYLVIARPAQLVFDAMGALGTVTLERVANETHMMVTIRCSSAEHLAMFVKIGVDVGTDRTFDNLVAYLATRVR